MVTHTRLGEILAQEGRSQTWLAGAISARLGRHVIKQEVYRWVRGIHTPEPATRAAIADALHRQVADVFPPTDPQEIAA